MEFLNIIGRGLANLLTDQSNNDRYLSTPFFQMPEIFNPSADEFMQLVGQERKIYETTAPLAIVIDRKASMKSVGVLKHWKGNKNTTEDTELLNTPELNLLYNPNPLQSKDDFFRELSVNRDVMGVNYTYGKKGSRLNTVPRVLYNIQPELLQIRTKQNIWEAETEEEIYDQILVTATGQTFEPFEIWRRSLVNASNLVKPASPFHKIRMEISNIRSAMVYRSTILNKKGAIGMLSGDQRDSDGTVALDAKEHARIEKEYQRSWGLYTKQMQILMSRYPMKWTPMSYPTKDMMLFEEIDSNMMKIIDLYGMNQNVFSFQKGTSLSDAGTKMLEAERQIYQNTIIPESEDDMNSLSKWLGLHKRGEYLTLDYSHVPAMADNEELAVQIMTAKISAFTSLMALENGVSLDQAMEMVGLKND